MPAHENLHPGQFPEALTASQIKVYADPGDPDGYGPHKFNEAHHRIDEETGESLVDSIGAEGVRSPVQIGHPYTGGRPILVEGHRRVAVAEELRPNDLIPIEHLHPQRGR